MVESSRIFGCSRNCLNHVLEDPPLGNDQKKGHLVIYMSGGSWPGSGAENCRETWMAESHDKPLAKAC